ncbi:MAG: hypothetical protein MJE68_10710, partial [Proteobacteria bacterium]|nr:hypothetical protein [Pseudomonadota bacterium]
RNPKQTIVSTFVTFLLLSYSKLLLVSCKFLFAVQSYTSCGVPIPNSAVLLHDPTISFFKIDHIPYIIVALFFLATFILLPPLLLLTYPSCLFGKLLTFCGFRRWDILQMIMDAFQGWYKDGTEGTQDYRSLSAVFMLLKIAIVGGYLTGIQLFFTEWRRNKGDYGSDCSCACIDRDFPPHCQTIQATLDEHC